MFRTLSLTLTSAAALFVFASDMNIAAQAADRSIAVEAKPSKLRPLFRVEESTDQNAVDVANANEDAGPKRIEPKSFRVEETPPRDEASVDTGSANPKPKNTFRFRVEEQTNQVADTPVGDETTPAVKDIKGKAAAAVSEDEQNQAIADDESDSQQGPVVLEDQAQTEEQAAPAVKQVAVVKHRKSYVNYDEQDNQYTDGYQAQGYDLPSCHNKSYGY
jgi:hypothetical protein